jgi:hypothetical protein
MRVPQSSLSQTYAGEAAPLPSLAVKKLQLKELLSYSMRETDRSRSLWGCLLVFGLFEMVRRL